MHLVFSAEYLAKKSPELGTPKEGIALEEGDTKEIEGHEGRLFLDRWKLRSRLDISSTSYSIEKPRNPENRGKYRPKIGKIREKLAKNRILSIFLLFSGVLGFSIL